MSIINNAGNALVAQIAPETSNEPSLTIKARTSALLANYSTSTRDIALSIIESESAFQNVTGITGDMGLAQFSPPTWKENCTGDPFNINNNVTCLVELLDRGELWRWRASMYSRKNYQGWLDKVSTTTRNYIKNKCQCVTYARNQGLDLPRVEKADDLIPNTFPFIGSGVLFDSNHIGVLRAFIYGGIRVESGNCDNRCRVCTKDYKWEDVRGFIK